MYPNWYENLWKDCHTRIWPQEVTEWAADGFTSIAKLTFLSHSEYLQLLSTKIKYYLIYWSRRALENTCLLRESVCGLHFVDRCSTWRQRGNSMTAASRFWRLADFEAALRLVDVRISELCQGFRRDMPWWWIWWQFEMHGMYHAADSNRTLTLRCMHLVRRWCTVLKELLLKTLPAHCYNIELIASDSASYCTFTAHWQCSGTCIQCILWPPGFGISWKHSCEWRQRPFQKSRQCLKVAYNILQLLARCSFQSCHLVSCRVSLKSLLAFVQGLESMLKALLQERVLTKVGRLLSCSATLSDNSIESRKAVLFRDGLFKSKHRQMVDWIQSAAATCKHMSTWWWYIMNYYDIFISWLYCTYNFVGVRNAWALVNDCEQSCLFEMWGNTRKQRCQTMSPTDPHGAKLIRLELQGPFDFLADANVLEVRFPSSVRNI